MSYELLHMTRTKEKEGKKNLISMVCPRCTISNWIQFWTVRSSTVPCHAAWTGRCMAPKLTIRLFLEGRALTALPHRTAFFFFPPNGLANVIHPFARQNIHITHRNVVQPQIIYFLASLKNSIYRSILCLSSSPETTRKDWGNWMNIVRR